MAFFAERGRALGGSSGRGAGRGRRAVALGRVGRQGRGGARRGRCAELREPSGTSRMAAAAGEARRVLVYGGRGALGSRCVQAFRARNWVANWAGGAGGSAPRAGLRGGRAGRGAWEPSGASREGSLEEGGGPCAPADMWIGTCTNPHIYSCFRVRAHAAIGWGLCSARRLVGVLLSLLLLGPESPA